jgi:hypothetical protein
MNERRETMKNQNRVLGRLGARDLTLAEASLVTAGFVTFSLCTAAPSPDGDTRLGEVGC